MPSYTALAADLETRPIVPPAVLTQPDAAEAWIEALPEPVRGRLKARLAALVRSLPPVLKLDLQRTLAARAEASPVPLEGLGTWGALATGLSTLASTGIQVGVNLYTAKEQSDLSKDLASQSAATQSQIERIRAEAAVTAAKLMAEAQVEAAKQAAGSGVARTSVVAKAGVAGLAVIGLGLGAYFVMRKKRK